MKWLAFFIPGIFLTAIGLALIIYRLLSTELGFEITLDIFLGLFFLGPGIWLILIGWQGRPKAAP